MTRLTVLSVVLLAVAACERPVPIPDGGFTSMNDAEAKSSREQPDATARIYSVAAGGYVETERVVRSDEEWKRELDPVQYEVMRRKGTERAFTGKYWDSHAPGRYTCGACGADLFLSETKFDSGCGWPSFYAPVDTANVTFTSDSSHGMARTEVTCSRCGAHLGHIFDDGPAPTGQRYCMNSASLGFVPEGTNPSESTPPPEATRPPEAPPEPDAAGR